MTESFPSGGRWTKRFLLPCRGLEGAFPCRIQIDRKTQKRPRSSPMRMSSLRRSETAAHCGSGPGRIIPRVRPADRGDRRTGFARSVFLFDCLGMTLQRCAGFSVSSPSFFFRSRAARSQHGGRTCARRRRDVPSTPHSLVRPTGPQRPFCLLSSCGLRRPASPPRFLVGVPTRGFCRASSP